MGNAVASQWWRRSSTLHWLHLELDSHFHLRRPLSWWMTQQRLGKNTNSCNGTFPVCCKLLSCCSLSWMRLPVTNSIGYKNARSLIANLGHRVATSDSFKTSFSYIRIDQQLFNNKCVCFISLCRFVAQWIGPGEDERLVHIESVVSGFEAGHTTTCACCPDVHLVS